MSDEIKKYMFIVESALTEQYSDDEVIPKSDVSYDLSDEDDLDIDDEDEKLLEAFGGIRRMTSSLRNKEKKFFKKSVSDLIKRFWTIEKRIVQKTKRLSEVKIPVYDKKFIDELVSSMELDNTVKQELKTKHYQKLNTMIKKYQGVRDGKKDKETLKKELLDSNINPTKILTDFIEDAAYAVTYYYFIDNKEDIQKAIDGMGKDKEKSKEDKFFSTFVSTYTDRMKKGKKG